MRAAGATPEPFGGGGASAGGATGAPAGGGGRFVVQKHAATRLHYDFRLEVGGVLWSWAVPRGPSPDPADKRMAVHVEDHPLDYADFEGVIPPGNYGAGAVIVWDRGHYDAVHDMTDGLARGKLLFDLHGIKLRGRYTLVRSGRRGGPGNEWLLIKERDAHADPGVTRPPGEHSVLSGLAVDQLATARSREAGLLRRATRLGAPARAVAIDHLEPMLAEPRARPFSDPGWLFELKYDGYRLLAARQAGEVRLRYRSGRDATALYPEIGLALRALPHDDLVLDGEVVVFDDEGRSDFGLLQQRAAAATPRDVARAAAELPVSLVAFDLVAVGGRDLRGVAIEQRKAMLAEILPRTGVVRHADHIVGRGEDFYRALVDLGLEGMVAKRLGSPYRAGRSADWRKIRLSDTADFAVVGWTRGRGARSGFGALHLAVRRGTGWRYAGRVGSGFSQADLDEIGAVLDGCPPARYPFKGLPGAPSTWIEPRLVVRVRFKQWREHLRAPVFLGLCRDRRPEDCGEPVEHAEPPPPPTAATATATAAAAAPPRDPPLLTNLDKVFWPESGYTKGDLVDYYRGIAPWLLPYLRDRPLVLTRFPDGITGKSFYQKDAPTWSPAWLRTATVWSESTERDIRYFVADDLDALLYLINSGTIPLHVWPSRVASLTRPDWCILDLDPKGAPLAHVVELALAIRRLCDSLALPSYVKTSGQAGLHVLLPLGRALTFAQSTQLAGLLAGVIEREHGDLATMNRVIRQRRGRVYLDWLQNRHGQLLVAPFSARPVPGAPVSMPLRWSEVGPRLDPTGFTIATARRRMERLAEDPLLPVIAEIPPLLPALAALAERLAKSPS
jgi:bifunctional non-homologous end joining protein LigD